MTRAIALLVLLLFPVSQSNVDGEWAATLTLPYGETFFTMMLVQKDKRVSGYILNETGQFDLNGTVERDEVTVEWSYPDGGKILLMTFKGKVTADSISGPTKIGNVATGTITARRK
jgi:hypothetical protein